MKKNKFTRDIPLPSSDGLFGDPPKKKSVVVLPKTDYDRDFAPKEGKFLKPDINRPSYIDEFGDSRSEYKMGINDKGKEVLIPTVVNGRQLSEMQAIKRYQKTGYHMGKFKSVADAEKASEYRTAKYNMLADPVRYKKK
jgi:hypothetical protein